MSAWGDDDWLADDEGSLRPEVARALGQVPGVEGRELVQTDGDQSFLSLLGATTAIVAFIGCLVLLTALLFGNRQPDERESKIWVSNAYLMSAPSNEAPPIQTLGQGERIKFLARQEGWCKVKVRGRRTGWVYLGQIRGASRYGAGAAMLTRDVIPDGAPPGMLLRARQAVFVEAILGRGSILVLPNGEKARVPTDALTFAWEQDAKD